MAHVGIQCSDFGCCRTLIVKVRVAARAAKSRARHGGKAGEFAAVAGEQLSRGGCDGTTIQATAQLCTDASARAQPHPYCPVKLLSETLQVFLRRTQAKICEVVRTPVTPQLGLV